jgi:UDP-N-acetylmuramoyl-tripeptide--D-alanyl-D-alanine ligase
VKDALHRGAAACVIREHWYQEHQGELAGARLIVVPDVLKALQALAKAHRQKYDLSVIGITGTNGKTTCKDMIFSVLSRTFDTVATQGNLNNEIGVPLSLLRIDENTQVAVIEMGANKRGDIAFLCDLCDPDSGVITNIGTAHLGSFGSVENIVATKNELFDALAADGVRFVNVDDPYLRPHAKQTKGLVTYGVEQPAEYRAQVASMNGKGCPHVEFRGPDGHSIDVELSVPGRHQVYHALVAAAMGWSLGVDDAPIREALERHVPLSNRLGIKRHGHLILIDDTYNANPDSMRAAVDTLLAVQTAGRRIAVLGDMLELGPSSAHEHESVGRYLAEGKVDAVFLTGEGGSFIRKGCTGIPDVFHFEKKKELASALKIFLRDLDVVLFKGSRGMRMDEILQEIMV